MEEKENQVADSNDKQSASSSGDDSSARFSEEIFDSMKENSSKGADSASAKSGFELSLSAADRSAMVSSMITKLATDDRRMINQGESGSIGSIGQLKPALPELSLEERMLVRQNLQSRANEELAVPDKAGVSQDGKKSASVSDKPSDSNSSKDVEGALQLIRDLKLPATSDRGWSLPINVESGAQIGASTVKGSKMGSAPDIAKGDATKVEHKTDLWTADMNSDVKTLPEKQSDKVKNVWVLPIEGDSEIAKKAMSNQRDMAAMKSLIAAGEAKDKVDQLSPEKREQWNDFQMKIALSTDPAERVRLQNERNEKFPDIAKKIEEARQQSKEAQDWSNKLDEQAQRERAAKPGQSEPAQKDVIKDILGAGSAKGKMPNFDFLKDGVFGNKKSDATEPTVRLSTLPEIAEKNLRELDSPTEKQVLQIRADQIDNKLAMKGVSEEERAKFKDDAKKIIENDKHTDAQKNESFDHVNRLIDGNSKSGLSEAQCIKLGLQVADQIANPFEIDQGPYPTCNVTTVEVAMYAKHPEKAAKVVADLALNGETNLANGDLVKLDKGSLQPANKDAVTAPKPENIRTHASQIFQLAAVNNFLDHHNAEHGQDIRLINTGAETGNPADKLMDFSTNPPREITGGPGALKDFTCETGEVKDAQGRVQLDENLNPIKHTALPIPGLNEPAVMGIAERFSNQKAEMLISRDNTVQRVALYMGYGPEGITNVVNAKQLGEHLAKAKAEGRLPITISVHTAQGFLREQTQQSIDAANKAAGKPGGAGDEVSGSGHVVSIVDYDPATGKVSIDNQWGKSRDKRGNEAVTLDQAIAIMQAPDNAALAAKAQAKAAATQEQRREDYQAWCKSEGKTPGEDYPTAKQFQDWQKKRATISRR